MLTAALQHTSVLIDGRGESQPKGEALYPLGQRFLRSPYYIDRLAANGTGMRLFSNSSHQALLQGLVSSRFLTCRHVNQALPNCTHVLGDILLGITVSSLYPSIWRVTGTFGFLLIEDSSKLGNWYGIIFSATTGFKTVSQGC